MFVSSELIGVHVVTGQNPPGQNPPGQNPPRQLSGGILSGGDFVLELVHVTGLVMDIHVPPRAYTGRSESY